MKPSRAGVLIALATAFSLLGDQMLYSVLPTYYVELGLMPYQVGLVLSVNRWVRLVTNSLAEWMCRHYDLTFLVTLALIFGAVLTLVYGMMTSFWVLVIARMLWGLSWSFIRQIGVMTVIDSSPPALIGRMMGFYNGTSRLGSVSGNLIGAVGHDVIGFSLTMIIFGVVSLLGVPLGWMGRRAVPHQEVDAKKQEGKRWSPELLFCGFVIGCVGPGMVMSTLGVVLKDTVGDSVSVFDVVIGVATLNGLLLSIRWITDALGAPLLGAVSDKMGRRWATIVYFVGGMTALFVASLVSNVILLVVCVLAFFACGVGLTVVMIAESGMRGSRSVATYVTASDFGSAAGPMLGWLTLQMQLSTDWIFLMGGGLYAAGMVMAMVRFR
ncbi:MAG: MFS transporter [Candidatus Latescibacteria bacterium]|nr:MFS transporter [Candidatus Latescibacterota bacterium]MBT5831697.1 MFS transporter [Candidatus Latescibacterota bacterium]